jgi:hypothetical protein
MSPKRGPSWKNVWLGNSRFVIILYINKMKPNSIANYNKNSIVCQPILLQRNAKGAS